MDFLDESVHLTIHKDVLKTYAGSVPVMNFVKEFSDMEFYPGGMKNGKPVKKILELKRLTNELVKIRKKNKGKESNVECMIYDQIQELLRKMMLKDLRKVSIGVKK